MESGTSGRLAVLSRTPWAWEYRPVITVARLGAHSELVTKALRKRIPSRARRSRLGVFRTLLPAQLRASWRWSSVIRTTRLGRSAAAASGAARAAAARVSRKRRGMAVVSQREFTGQLRRPGR